MAILSVLGVPSADAQHMMMGGQEGDKSYNEQHNFKLMKLVPGIALGI